MFKYYLQIISVLVTFFSAIICSCWVVLTLMYYSHSIETGEQVSLNIPKIGLALFATVVNVVGFVLAIKWVKRTKIYRDEKIRKFREITRL